MSHSSRTEEWVEGNVKTDSPALVIHAGDQNERSTPSGPQLETASLLNPDSFCVRRMNSDLFKGKALSPKK